jgi:hypothetical protein
MHKFERRIARLEAALDPALPPEVQGQGMLGLLRLAETYQTAEAEPWEEETDETAECPEEPTGFVRLL